VFTGKQSPEEIQFYYNLGNVFVTASTSETQGLVYIEAMGTGIPVIARYDDCLESVLVEGETGYTFKDREGFIDAVVRYYNNSTEQKLIMQKKSLEKASEFSLESFGDRVVQVYYQAIHRKKMHKSKRKAYKERKQEQDEVIKEEKDKKLKRKLILKQAKVDKKSKKRRIKIANKNKDSDMTDYHN
ncbi:MAG: mgtA 2, partial [Clostridia bacterium]|nr:mgtA 2 [Clostridia bacterium]